MFEATQTPLHPICDRADDVDISKVSTAGFDVASLDLVRIGAMAVEFEGSLVLQKLLMTDWSAFAQIRDAVLLSFAHLARHPHANFVVAEAIRAASRCQLPLQLAIDKAIYHFISIEFFIRTGSFFPMK